MSFLSVLQKIHSVFTKVSGVVTPLEPAIAMIPGYGLAFDNIFNIIVQIEGIFAQTSGLGPAKKAIVTQVATALDPKVDQTALSTKIDNIVTHLNGLQKEIQ